MSTAAVVLSDLHLGAPDSLLAPKGMDATAYQAYLDRLLFNPLRAQSPGGAKFLVVNGDVHDFALQPYADAFASGAAFFKAVAASGLLAQMIYLPGNHDRNVWTLLQHENNVISPLTKGSLPTEYPHVQAGVLDAKTGTLQLPGVSLPYGDFFLKGLFQVGASAGAPLPSIPINVVYPNLYVTGGSESARPLLITHGHFFFFPWVVLTEVFPKNLGIDKGYSLVDLDTINAPITELAWTSLGQAGKLTAAARRVYGGVESGNTGPVNSVLDEMGEYLDEKKWNYHWYDPREIASDAGIKGLKWVLEKFIEDAVSGARDHRGDTSCLDDGETQDRIRNYLALSRSQFSDLQPGNALTHPIRGHLCPYPCADSPRPQRQPEGWVARNRLRGSFLQHRRLADERDQAPGGRPHDQRYGRGRLRAPGHLTHLEGRARHGGGTGGAECEV